MTVSTLASVPFRGQIIDAQKDGETVKVALKPICENLGLNANGQIQRLKRQPWAVTCVIHATGSDGKAYDMVAVDCRTFTMWLATIDTRRVRSLAARELIKAYQQEGADALDRYFNMGIAVNEHLVKAQHMRRMEKVELLQAAEGLVHPDFLEAKTRIVLAREMGESPELDPASRPLYVQDYLKEKQLGNRELRHRGGVFGKNLKQAYIAAHGCDPKRADFGPDPQGVRVHGGRPAFVRTGVGQGADQGPPRHRTGGVKHG